MWWSKNLCIQRYCLGRDCRTWRYFSLISPFDCNTNLDNHHHFYLYLETHSNMTHQKKQIKMHASTIRHCHCVFTLKGGKPTLSDFLKNGPVAESATFCPTYEQIIIKWSKIFLHIIECIQAHNEYFSSNNQNKSSL